jgi:hypothetical protein
MPDPAPQPEVCRWTDLDDSLLWESFCGGIWNTYIGDTWRFCPYCGRPLVVETVVTDAGKE